jgi:hypothetical protein
LCAKRVFDIERLSSLSWSVSFHVHHYSSAVEVKSTGVPVKGNHVEGLCQLSLERATAVEDEWVACLIQDRVIAKVL